MALDLAIQLGWKVFPLNKKTKTPFKDTNGHLDATDDTEQIATWFAIDYPDAGIGVATGPSGIVAADLDRKKTKDGFQSVEDAWLDLPTTFYYPTPNGGEHKIYVAPKGKRLTGNADYRGLSGFDRRAGSSYVMYYADRAPDPSELAPAPEWLCDESTTHLSNGYGGDVQEWLDAYGQGEPDKRVQAAIARIKRPDMGHSDMVEDQFNFIRLGAEGAIGVAEGLEQLRNAWLSRDPAAHSTPQSEWDYKFEEALASGVAKYGDEVELITELPSYFDALSILPSDFPMDLIEGSERLKPYWFKLAKELGRFEIDEAESASIIWNAPSVKKWSREWGIDYCYAQLEVARAAIMQEVAPREFPGIPLTDVKPAEASGEGFRGIQLVNSAEREYIKTIPTFITQYIDYASFGSPHNNLPYYRAAALNILSMAFGFYGFILEGDEGEDTTMGCNLWIVSMGESSTGKTRTIKRRDAILKKLFFDDAEYNIGGNPSPEWLHEELIRRDGLASFFNADEAASVFALMSERSYAVTLEQDLARYYEGYVPPVGKKSSKDIAGKSGLTAFNMGMFGTPARTTKHMNSEMFGTGFVPRIIWYYGDAPIDTDDRFKVSRGNSRSDKVEESPRVRALVSQLTKSRADVGRRRPIHETDEAIARLEKAKKDMELVVVNQSNFALIQPSVVRLGDSIRKVAALFAQYEGRKLVYLRDMLLAIEMAEEWLFNVTRVSEDISATAYQRDVRDMVLYVQAKGGSVSEAHLAHRFANVGTGDPRDFSGRLLSAEMQGMLKKLPATNSRGVYWEVNTKALEAGDDS